ncbi:FBD-associated F-box protein At3g52670-like [Corylus avellana]|uniref:FBD-associated F-box protein At3g52670-like n=1 Tax=Corylus avellana TaxID=13451 RepID=UPI002869F077|nr:FBD-associated F-box protein At3g52670-like [Corylus avellana]
MDHKIDRLSVLPEPVMEHILSFMPLKRTLQLSILSKRWQKVWTLFPIPEFNSNFYSSDLSDVFDSYEISDKEKKQKITIKREEREKFNYFVERTLVSRCRQKLGLNKFNLKILVMHEPDYILANRWIGYAIECNVKELNLCLKSYFYDTDEEPDDYQVPKSVLTAKSIVKLKLSGGSLKSCYSDINLSSLRKLVLKRVDMNDRIFRTLISGCPVLEEITIRKCYGLKNIHLQSLPRLVAVTLLYSPKLRSFKLEAPNLKKLLVESTIVTDKWLYDVLSKHPLIESLELRDCSMLKMIKISSDHLKSLTICHCTKLIEVDIITLNLHRLEYCGDVISFSSNAWTLSEVRLDFKNYAPLDVKKIEFLAKLNHPKFLAWDAIAKSVIASKELRETVQSPLYNVKQLKLKVRNPYNIIELVDALLWISPLLEILWIEWWRDVNICFKFSYEDRIYKLKNHSCCKLLPILCWRHCLKTVQIENYGGAIEKETLKRYFSKNAEILESFQYRRLLRSKTVDNVHMKRF